MKSTEARINGEERFSACSRSYRWQLPGAQARGGPVTRKAGAALWGAGTKPGTHLSFHRPAPKSTELPMLTVDTVLLFKSSHKKGALLVSNDPVVHVRPS